MALTPTGSSAKPWVKDGYDAPYPSYRVINGVKPRLEQRVGEWVCKWGRTTQLTCGTILSIYVSVQENGFPPSPATYILVAGGLVDLSQERDSGAPWFSYDTAYGIHKGHLVEMKKTVMMQYTWQRISWGTIPIYSKSTPTT
jgi:hypothetical protein